MFDNEFKEEISMKQKTICSCYSGVDQMINEGLGGGFILYEYDRKKLEAKVLEANDQENTNAERYDF